MGNDQAKVLVEEYLEVEGYPKETRRKVFKHFRKDIEQKNADLETIVEQLRSGDHTDLRRNEEYILRALPPKYEMKCYQFLYEERVKKTRLFRLLVENAAESVVEEFMTKLCMAVHRIVCLPNKFILDLWKPTEESEKRWEPTSPILVFLREGSVEFVEVVNPGEEDDANDPEAAAAAIEAAGGGSILQTLNFPEHRIIGPGYTIETSPLIGDRLILQTDFVLARAMNPHSTARRTRVAVRAKDDTAYGAVRKRDFDQIVASLPPIQRRYDELLAVQAQLEADARGRVQHELSRVTHTALINAVSCGNASDILRAISAGADVTATSLARPSGATGPEQPLAIAIHVAAQFAQEESLVLLLEQPTIIVEQPRPSDGMYILHTFQYC